jgi:uncharacterized caspase-like protein
MMGWRLFRNAALALLTVSPGFCFCVHAQGIRCGAGQDLVVQALEQISPQSSNDTFEDALELLKHAVAECPELGDAWYYRSLVEKHLGHTALANYALDKARFNGSEALNEGLDPFVLSTPASRGFETSGATTPVPTAPPVRPGPVQQKWALVVGIGQFTDTAIPRLHYTTDDAKAFAAALEDPNIGGFSADNVHVLADDQATTKNIKEQLNWIARNAQPNDLVVIYVATHGTPRTMDTAGANYLVTYDTEIYHAGNLDQDSMYATAYPMVELANAVATRMKALRTAVFLDTCYSGGAAGTGAAATSAPAEKLASAAPSEAMLAHMIEGTGRIVMTASQVNEESLESDQLHHGYFTYYLLQALKSGKGETPLSEIYSKVAQQVSQSVTAQGMHQHPVMDRSSANADFALRSPAAATASARP